MTSKFERNNPYPYTAQSIASEIMQLLLVVERIKADKNSLQRLKSLVKVRLAFEESPQVRSLKRKSPFHLDRDNLPLSTLCSILDKGLGVTSFSSKAVQFSECKRGRQRPQDPTTFLEAPEHHWSKVWTEDIPSIIDAQHYRFENLNPLRLHYPHLQILLAYVYGKELLLVVHELIDLDYFNFVESAQDWVKREFGYIHSDNNSSDLPLILARQVTERATDKYLNELDIITKKAKRYLNWSFEEGNHFNSPKVEQQKKEWIDALGNSLGEQPILSVDVLQADVKRAIGEGDLSIIATKIAHSLANKIQPDRFNWDAIDNNEYRQGLADIYEQYSSGRTQLLWHGDIRLQLNYKTLCRGIGFSIWRDKYQEETGKKIAVLEVAKEFLVEEKGQPYANGTPNTIKQSYEKLKGYAKRSESKNRSSLLVELIRSQMSARLPFDTPKIRYVFAPFNIHYEDKIRDVADKFIRLLELETSQLSYDDVCELFLSLSSQDISRLKRDHLIELLSEIGLERSEYFNYSRLNRNSLIEVLGEDILTGIGKGME